MPADRSKGKHHQNATGASRLSLYGLTECSRFFASMDPFRPFGTPPGMPPASCALRPCAGLRRLQGLAVEFCSSRSPWTSSAPSGHLPRARGRLRGLLRWLFCRRARAQAEGCIPPGGTQRLPAGMGPTPKALHSGCQNAAAGGEVPLLLIVSWVTFSCALKPECIPQRLLHLFTSSLRVTACRLPFSRLRRQLPRPHPSAFGCHLPQRGRL